jgi:hypothetical protein
MGRTADRGRNGQISTTMAYLHDNWGEVYTFAVTNGKHTARARFSAHDLLEADTPEELLLLVRRHYPGKRANQA